MSVAQEVFRALEMHDWRRSRRRFHGFIVLCVILWFVWTVVNIINAYPRDWNATESEYSIWKKNSMVTAVRSIVFAGIATGILWGIGAVFFAATKPAPLDPPVHEPTLTPDEIARLKGEL